jgi:hypothetical protein
MQVVIPPSTINREEYKCFPEADAQFLAEYAAA